MAIMVMFYPDALLNDIESMGIRMIVCWHGVSLGQVSSLPLLIKYVHTLLEFERESVTSICRTYCMIIGNYGGHLAYATDPPFCMAYALDFVIKNDPVLMAFRNQENHPVSFTGDGLIICQLLAQDCMEHKYKRTTRNGCLLIPKGVQSTKELFTDIVALQNHAAPHSLQNRKGGSFCNHGSFQQQGHAPPRHH